MKRHGFTVWELLAVIIIILVVAAILFPVFAKSHRPYRHGSCASNMKQIGLGIFQYAQDNDDNIPDIAAGPDMKTTWRTMTFPYIKMISLFMCPDRDDKGSTLDGFPISYAANYTGNYSGAKNDKGDGAFAGPGSKAVNMGDFDSPEHLIMLCEVARTNRPEFNIDNLAVFSPNSNILWAGHQGGNDYLFADGHVNWRHPLDTKTWWHRNTSMPLSPWAVAILQNAQDRAGK